MRIGHWKKKVDDTENTIQFNEWSEFSSRHKNYFSETDGLIKQLSSDINPYDIFALFVDDW